MSAKPNRVLVTGASSGIGLETAIYFLEKGWQVIASMRHPEKRQTPLHDRGLEHLIHLDVTDPRTIRAAVKYCIDQLGGIDVLVNNAGYAVYGPFETTTQAQLAREFDTNVFGLMQLTREVLPHFRAQGSGVLINVASMGGRIGFPLYSLYNSSKWAVEGFSEALQYELKPLNIRVRLIEPGVIRTDFYDRSLDMADAATLPEAYDGIIRRGEKQAGGNYLNAGSEPRAAVKVIYQAATDAGWRLRYPVGLDARLVSLLRRFLPEGLFYRVLERNVLD
jgi:NAD(P)-dependent dehydrogenase (short-subunit alcohol dehydrogenase family)